MSEHIHSSHNVSVLIYHFVCPAKYRRVVFDDDVDNVLKEVCHEIEKRYDIRFLEIGAYDSRKTGHALYLKNRPKIYTRCLLKKCASTNTPLHCFYETPVLSRSQSIFFAKNAKKIFLLPLTTLHTDCR